MDRRKFLVNIPIFGFLFLKRLSDQFAEERKQIKGDPEDSDNYEFFVPERAYHFVLRAPDPEHPLRNPIHRIIFYSIEAHHSDFQPSNRPGRDNFERAL